MSDLLNSASLVMIPSGYKEDTVYSQIPTDGSGDLSFTRASNGTRVNSAGLVEVVAWNDLTYSEEFNNAAWSKFDASATANATTAPNGTTTADKFVEGTGSSIHRFNQGGAIVSGQSYTFSVYAKASERTRLLLRTNNGSADQDTYFDLTSGTIVSGTGTIENAGNGWYKLSRSLTATTSVSSNFICQLLLVNTGTNTSYTGDGTSGLFVWGAQLNIGSTAKPYFPTTDRLNVPRLTYQNGGGGCPSLLLEKQSTNLCTYSQDFSNAAWNVSVDSGCSLAITPNYTTASNGLPAARLVASRTNTSTLAVLVNYAPNTGTSATKSIWMKNNNPGNVTIMFGDEAVTITDSWERYSVTNTYIYSIFGLRYSGVALSCDISITGSQFELGSYATSYIPTTSASATRVADACFKTGISSLIGQTEGVMFVDFVLNGFEDYGTPLSLNDGSLNSYIWFTTFANGNIRVEAYSAGNVQAQIVMNGGVIGQRYKMAFGYKANDFVLYINGTQIGTDNSGSVPPNLSRLDFDLVGAWAQQSQKINQTALFKTRLTNAELASLTTI